MKYWAGRTTLLRIEQIVMLTCSHAAHATGKSWTSAIWHNALLPLMDKTVGELMPELKDSVYGNQTVRVAVDMRSPDYWYEDYTITS